MLTIQYTTVSGSEGDVTIEYTNYDKAKADAELVVRMQNISEVRIYENGDIVERISVKRISVK